MQERWHHFIFVYVLATSSNACCFDENCAVEVRGGKIVSVLEGSCQSEQIEKGHVVDYGEAVVMPGLIDV